MNMISRASAFVVGFLVLSNAALAGLVGVSQIVVSQVDFTDPTKPYYDPHSGLRFLQIGEVIATEVVTGNDLALTSMGATAVLSSVYPGDYGAQYAIDGLIDSNFAHAENEISGALTIDLAAPTNLQSLTIFGRPGSGPEQHNQRDIFDVRLFDSSGALLFEAFELNANNVESSVLLDLSGVSANDAGTVSLPSGMALLLAGIVGFGLRKHP